MSLTMQQKRGLFWALGILIMLTLSSVAWAQTHTTLAHFFSFFGVSGGARSSDRPGL
jgi:hypothetical protein